MLLMTATNMRKTETRTSKSGIANTWATGSFYVTRVTFKNWSWNLSCFLWQQFSFWMIKWLTKLVFLKFVACWTFFPCNVSLRGFEFETSDLNHSVFQN
jgi:hypothetical protein